MGLTRFRLGFGTVSGTIFRGTAAHNPLESLAEGLQRTVIQHLGDLGHDLDDDEIEALGALDAVLIPIGGTYTLDCQQASDLADRLQVKAVIPMHYRRDDMGFDVLQTLQEFTAYLFELIAK